jgi:hypothetical protein
MIRIQRGVAVHLAIDLQVGALLVQEASSARAHLLAVGVLVPKLTNATAAPPAARCRNAHLLGGQQRHLGQLLGVGS